MASWLVLTLLSALLLGVYDVCKKDAVCDNPVMPVLWITTLFGAVAFSLLLIFTGQFPLVLNCTPQEYGWFFLKSLLVSSSWICVFYAMRELPISLASPIRSTSPLWTVVGGIIIFNEIPNRIQAVGMLVVFIGYYLFSVLGKSEGFNWRSRGIWLIISGTLLGAASALFDKFILGVLALERVKMQFYFSVNLVLILGLALLARRGLGSDRKLKWRWSIAATGILLIGADYAYFYAVSMAGAPISLISLVRRCSCLVAFLIGVKYFREVNIRRKAVALILLLIGVALLSRS